MVILVVIAAASTVLCLCGLLFVLRCRKSTGEDADAEAVPSSCGGGLAKEDQLGQHEVEIVEMEEMAQGGNTLPDDRFFSRASGSIAETKKQEDGSVVDELAKVDRGPSMDHHAIAGLAPSARLPMPVVDTPTVMRNESDLGKDPGFEKKHGDEI